MDPAIYVLARVLLVIMVLAIVFAKYLLRALGLTTKIIIKFENPRLT